MVTPICLLKPSKLNPINWGEQGDTDFEALKKNLMRPPALGHPNYQLPFCLFVYEKKGNVLRALTQKHAECHQPAGYCSQQLNPMAQGSLLPQSLSCHCSLVKATEEIWSWDYHGIPFNHLCTPCRGSPLEFSFTQHFSVSCLTSYEILLLTAPHISLSHLPTSALLLFSSPSLQNPSALPDTDKNTASMNQHWWGNMNKTIKSICPLVPSVQNKSQRNLFALLPDILNCLMSHLRFGRWNSYSCLHLMDINMF